MRLERKRIEVNHLKLVKWICDLYICSGQEPESQINNNDVLLLSCI